MESPGLPDGNERPPAVAGPVSAQAAFNATWDLLTRWRRGERVPAAAYGILLGAEVFLLPEVLYALAAAEDRARLEAGLPPPSEGYGWLQGALPGRSEVYFRLVELLVSYRDSLSDRPATRNAEYSYLADPISPGDLGRLAHFRVIREIGRGGFGVVFEVEHTVLGGRRALKLLASGARTADSGDRFRREARAMIQIQDANVVRVYTAGTAGEANEVTYIEMEYVYGPTLEDLISHHLGGPAPLPLAADLIRQTSLGLAAAHDHPLQLAHRDVTPSNILLEWVLEDDQYPSGWRARVCDFGLAVAAGQTRLTQDGHVAGTIPYLAPEQFTPGSTVDGRKADVFALGVIAYELMTGRHPFKGDTPVATICNLKLCKAEPLFRADGEIPRHLEQLVLEMLERSPDRRPSAQKVAAELSQLLGMQAPATTAPLRAGARLSDQPRAEAALRGPAARGAGESLVRPAEPTPAGVPLTLDLAVTVWKKEDTTRGLSIDVPSVLPVRAGDIAWLEVRVNRPAYVYIVQLEANGSAVPLYPWRECDWCRRGEERPNDRVEIPEDPLTALPFGDGPSGIEAFVVLAREGRLQDEENDRLRGLFEGGPKQEKFDPMRGVVWFGSDEVPFDQQVERGRVDATARRLVEDPVIWLRRLLRSERFLDLSSVSRGVCYPFAGR